MYRFAWMLILAGLFAAVGCERKPADRMLGAVVSEDVRPDAGQAVPRVSEDSKRIKAEFQKNLEARLNEMDGKLSQLRDKGRNLEGAAKASWDQKMAELDVKRDTARAKLEKVVRSSDKDWKKFQKEAELAWDDLERTFQDAEKEFR